MITNQTSPSSSSIPTTQASNEPARHVLVPIDFSVESVAALRAAASAAAKYHAHLTLLNVVECGTIYRGAEVPGSHRRLQQSHGRRLWDLVETVLPSSIEVDVIVGDGDPECEINRIAAQRHIDCIVVGRHHRRHWFGGDTARKVAESAPCQVIVLNGDDEVVAFKA